MQKSSFGPFSQKIKVVTDWKKMKALNASFDNIRVLVKQNLSEEFEIDDWQFYSQHWIQKLSL